MLIQKWKNDNNLCYFSQFYQGYIIFFKIYFQGRLCIQLFFFRKLQYFNFLSWCENIKESCLVLSEIFFVEILSHPQRSRGDKLSYVKVYTSKNPKSYIKGI